MTTRPPTAASTYDLYEAARRQAVQDRREAIHDFWLGADAAWARVQQGAAERLARSARRLRARIERRRIEA